MSETKQTGELPKDLLTKWTTESLANWHFCDWLIDPFLAVSLQETTL